MRDTAIPQSGGVGSPGGSLFCCFLGDDGPRDIFRMAQRKPWPDTSPCIGSLESLDQPVLPFFGLGKSCPCPGILDLHPVPAQLVLPSWPGATQTLIG